MSSPFTMSRALSGLRELGWTPGAIIDIGVSAGTEGLYDAWPGVPICLVEPSVESAPYLAAIAARYPSVTVFNVGASDHDGEMIGRQAEGSINVLFGKGRGVDFPARPFPVRTCDSMIAEAGLQGPFLYKLDTDAYEREILAGSERTLAQTDVCIIEANIFHGLRGCMTPLEIIALLDERGFSLFDIASVALGRESVLRCIDLVFVRREAGLMRPALNRSMKPFSKQLKRKVQADRALGLG